MSILFALITYLGWGIGDIFVTKATRKIGAFSSAFLGFVIAFILNSFYIPFALSDLNKFTPSSLLISIILAVLVPIPVIAFYEALRVGNAALVVTITSAFAAVSVLLSMIFLDEKVSLNQGVFIMVIFLGIILSSVDLKQLKGKNFLLDPGVPFAILATILWGVFFAFIKIPIKQVGWFWPGYISVLGFPLMLIFKKIKGIKWVNPTKTVLIWLLLAELLIGIGGFSYNFAISQGMIAVVAPIASSAATLFVLLSFLIFKDPITKQQIFGIITTLIGIVLLSVFSV